MLCLLRFMYCCCAKDQPVSSPTPFFKMVKRQNYTYIFMGLCVANISQEGGVI